MTLKIDIRKAFDSIDWDFLIVVLHNFGFSNKFCSWIQAIFNSARISILLNGSLKGYFSCSRGVRQGDPLSPHLFCLAEDYLNRRLMQLFGELSLVPMYATLRVRGPSHVLYADDVLIFCRATQANINKLVSVFEEYGVISGQRVNWGKSNIYFGSSVPSSRAFLLSNLVGMKMASFPLHYLGVPLFQGAPKEGGYKVWPIRC